MSSEQRCSPIDVPRRLAQISVLRLLDNSSVQLSSLWKDQPVLLCLFRRWGCGVCRMSAVNLSAASPLLATKNVRLVGVGVERLGFEEFLANGYFSGELFVDEGLAAYKALELPKSSWRNLWGLLDWGAVKKWFKLSQEKGYANNLEGNLTQLGGTFLIFPDGSVPYSHFQSKESFEPDVLRILDVLDVAVPQGFELYPAYNCRKKQ